MMETFHFWLIFLIFELTVLMRRRNSSSKVNVTFLCFLDLYEKNESWKNYFLPHFRQKSKDAINLRLFLYIAWLFLNLVGQSDPDCFPQSDC